MPRWLSHVGDILEVPADALICSANVYLTLSGGVAGAILLRAGDGMQRELNAYLERHRVRHVHRGDVIVTEPHGLIGVRHPADHDELSRHLELLPAESVA